MSEDALHEKAKELIRNGRLPARSPDRVWGGAGLAGARCALCGATIEPTDVVLEVEVRGDEGATYPQLHVRCFSVFEQALRDLAAGSSPTDRFGHQDAA